MKKNISGHDYGFGLKWDDLSSTKSKVEIQTILDENGCKFGVHKKIDSEKQQLGHTIDKSLSGCFSAAYVVSAILNEDDIVLIEKLDDDLYWICGILDGQIIGSTDTVVDGKNFIEEVDDLRSMMIDHEVEFKYYSDEDTSDYLMREVGISAIENKTFEDLINDAGDDIKLILKQAKIKSHKGISPLAIILLCITIFAIGSLFYISSSDSRKIDDSLFAKTESIIPLSKVIKSNKDVEKDALESAYAEEIRWLKDEFKKQNPVKLISAVTDKNISLPKYIAGWKIVNLKYNSDSPGMLAVEAERTLFGTPVTLREGLENYDGISLKKGGNTATIYYKLPDLKRDENIGNIISFIKKHDYKNAEMAHDSHYLGYIWSVDNYDTSVRKEPIKGIKDKKKRLNSQLKTIASSIKISGVGMSQLETSQLVFNKAKTTIIKSIEISRSGAQQWTIKGIIYER